jgi:TM2 domain-containing membrane protein YozV
MAIAQNLRNRHGVDPALSIEALDILEAALFGTASMPQYQQTQYQPVTSGGLWTAVLVCNILGLNWVSRFMTGHIGIGILVLLLNIVTVATLSVGIGWVLSVVCLIIYVIDLVKIGTKKWQTADGSYLVP